MRALVQRVTHARVLVAGEAVGRIGHGLLALVGVTHADTREDATTLARKLWHLRVFDDERGRMDRSAADTGGEVLVVSQFTLYADTSRGRRPSYAAAAPAEHAEPLVQAVADALAALGARVATGRFGARMQVELCNDGPVTVLVEVSATGL